MVTTEARGEFTAVLGDEGVITDQAELDRAATATFEITRPIPLILRPANRDEVQQCVFIANRLRIALYPISSGKNWGYGSRVPAADNTALLDLGRMNRIHDLNEELGYVTVEPGVTQQQVYELLAERGSKLWLDCTGASPDCSMIGNTLERGFGHTPYGDHFNQVANLEVVLPGGDVIETGFGRFGSVAAAPTYRWGVGPVLDGLFSQSNFGIVTRMTVWLMPKPEYFQAFFFSANGEESIGPIVDALMPLRLNGTLRSAAHIGNDYKVISGIQQYPWERAGGKSPLSPQLLSELAKEMDFGHWNGSGAFYGTRGQVAEARRLVQAALKGKVRRIRFLDDRKLAVAGRFAGPLRWVSGWDLSKTLELVRPVYGLMKGIPTSHSLRSVYWRKRFVVPDSMDPDRDRCGLLWCAPVAPMQGSHARKITAIARDIILKGGFEPLLSITLLTERTLACVISITYDRELSGEDGRAMDCYQELVTALVSNGYHFYRLGIQSMDQMNRHDTYASLLASIKTAIDPKGILAPGRYQSR